MLVFFMSSNSFGWLFFFFFVSTIAFIFMFSRVHRVVFVDKTSGGEDDRGAKGAEGVGCKFFDFGSQNGEFWCILGVLVTVLLLLFFTHKPSVIWPLPIFFAMFRCKKDLVHFLSFWCRPSTFSQYSRRVVKTVSA